MLTKSMCLLLDIDPYLRGRQFRPEIERDMDYNADMRRVRLQQQELARQRAIESAKEQKALVENEKKRKNKAALPPSHDDGTRLGRSTDNSFNPMQPWAQSSSGGYKPARRTVRRG
jgi:hypothetical protein